MSIYATIGHNNPPSKEEEIIKSLEQKAGQELEDYEAILREKENLPLKIDNDDDHGKITDYLKKLKNVSDTLDKIRRSEMAPHERVSNTIHSFFKRRIDNLKKMKDPLVEMGAEYLKRKEREERLKAEAEVKRIAEENARARKEAELKAKQAAEAQAAAEREAERIRKEAEAEQKRLAEQIEAEKKAAEAKLLAEKKAAEEKEKAHLAALEAQKAAASDAKKAMIEAQEAAAREKALKEKAELEKSAALAREAAAKEIREKEREARIKEHEAEKAVDAIKDEVSGAEIEAKIAGERADELERLQERKQRKILRTKSSEWARTRGDFSMSTVREEWKGEVESRDELDLEALRYTIPVEALNKAIQALVDTGTRTLKGAYIYPENKMVSR